MFLGKTGLNSSIGSKLDDSWNWVLENFPFPGYISPERKESYIGISYTAWKTLSGSGRVLDFGCGPLDKTALLSRLGLEVVAIDDFGDSWHRESDNLSLIKEYAKRSGVELHVPNPGGASIDLLEGPFDMIMLHHVLEHLPDSPKDLLNSLLDKLNPGGFLYVTVPNAVNLRKRLAVLFGNTNHPQYSSYYWSEGGYRGHIREYVRDDLHQLSNNLGMEMVRLGHYNHFWHAVPKYLRLGVRALCAIAPGFCDSCTLIARKPLNWQPKSTLSKSELHEALDSSVPFNYEDVLGSKTL